MARALSTVDQSVLAALLEQGGSVSVHDLAVGLGRTAEQAHESLKRLEELGCQIDSHPQHGLQLRSTGLGCWADFIESRHAWGLGQRTIVYGQTASTQDIARQIARQSAQSHGQLVVADHQQQGRGRLGHRWISRPGAQLLFTVIIDNTRCASAAIDRLMLASGLAIAITVESLGASSIRLHWPNDIYSAGGKLAGVLVETLGPRSLIGIGLNCDFDASPPIIDGPRRPVDLASLGVHTDRLGVLDRLLSRLEHMLFNASDEQLATGWCDRAGLLQQRITARSQGRIVSGLVIQIDPARGLVVELEQGPTVVLPAATTSLIDSQP